MTTASQKKHKQPKPFVPYDLKPPAVKLARRMQQLMSEFPTMVFNVQLRQFEGEWYLSVDHGKWEKLSNKY